MTARPLILSAHPDETVNAEIAFWSASANFELRIEDRRALEAQCANPDLRAVILELRDQDETALDLLAHISAATKAKIIALTSLDQKTISSIRRLVQVKAMNVIVQERADFSTRLLADLVRAGEKAEALDRETLSRAISDGHVIAHYQPKVPFEPGVERYGVEALCRIQHPSLGLIFPDSFIPLAEAHGLILDLTDAVTVHAFRSLAKWDRDGMPLRLALNISPSLLNDSIWFDSFQKRCHEFAVDPTRITLEVTESSSQGGRALALEILSRLRLKGFLLSIDDFGTGFSSLETLYKLPFGELKIDKGFVFDIHKSAEARTLIESTISLAKKLGLKICAEGVESQEIFKTLRDLKCDDAQGYHVSKPLPAERVVPFLEKWRTEQRELRRSPTSKFGNIHALIGELMAGDEDDHTVVLAAPVNLAPGEETAEAVASAIPALVMAGDMLKALATVHRATGLCQGPESKKLAALLGRVQEELESGLCPGTEAEVVIGEDIVRLLGGSNFIIGRQSANSRADIAIPCRWLSRGEKNLKLMHRDGTWLLEDLGSTNGHFLGSDRLAPNRPVSLSNGFTRIEVGRSADGSAPAWLTFEVDPRGAVRVGFGITGSTSQAENMCWIALHDAFAIGAAGMISASGFDDGVVAEICHRNAGLWIAPVAGQAIKLAGVAFHQPVPLVLDTSVEVGGATWPIRPLAAMVPETLPIAASA